MADDRELVVALCDIARALRQVEPGEPVAWRPDLLPAQVERELTHLRTEVKRLGRKVERLEAKDG